MNNRYIFLLVVLFACLTDSTVAQGIQGAITNTKGEPLPYTAVFVKGTNTGTTSTAEGKYSLKLPPGSYQITYQHLGYQQQEQQIKVSATVRTVNVTLKPQSFLLNTVDVSGKAEDPAYTIMRKAISKAKFHRLQLDAYSARVYIKGSGKLDKIPWLLRSTLEKEGIDTSKVYTSESVSEIEYERPNTYKEKVISIRTSGPDDNTGNPNSYVQSSFYNPYVVGSVSPLSPRAFSYYKFKYLGSFFENGYEVNKIKVTPRSNGEQVFSGTIFIRDGAWNIHSLSLQTRMEGFLVEIDQIYNVVAENIWMPTNQQIEFSGSMMGFKGSYFYTALVSEYEVEPNPELSAELTILDEKIDSVPAEIEAQEIKEETVEKLKEPTEKKLTRKQLKKMLDAYEKQEQNQKPEEEQAVVSDVWFEVDSTARKKDSAYWQEIRPIPLTEKEQKGYQEADSAYAEEKADSSQTANGGKFNVSDLFLGNTYRLGKRARFRFRGFLPELRYNTVEGYNLSFEGTLNWRNDSLLHLNITPEVRYGFESDDVYYQLKTNGFLGSEWRKHSYTLQGGRYIEQFHPNSINPLVNSLYTLLLARNYMRLYEHDFGSINYQYRHEYKFNLSVGAEYAQRKELFNNTTYTWFQPEGNEVFDNLPEVGQQDQLLIDGNAFTTALEFSIQPWMKYAKSNGVKRPTNKNSPEFKVSWNAGWQDVGESITDFHQLELGFKTTARLGVRATLNLEAEAGTFLTNTVVPFSDFKHFNGGLTELAPISLTGNYRLLDYYQYSTSQSYASGFAYVDFRKLLLTQSTLVRFAGIKESVFVNHLKTDSSSHYTEVGYSIDRIFRLFRLELVHSFEDGAPKDFGFRVGISTLIQFD